MRVPAPCAGAKFIGLTVIHQSETRSWKSSRSMGALWKMPTRYSQKMYVEQYIMRVSAVVLRGMVTGNRDTSTVQLREHFVGDISRGASLLSKCIIAAAKNAPNTCGLGLWRKGRGAVKGKLVIISRDCAESNSWIQNDNRDDEFLTSRILFLMTYDTSLDYEKLVTDHQLAESINQVKSLRCYDIFMY